MNVTALQIVALLVFGTAGCVSGYQSDSGANDENSGSTIHGDIRKQQHQDTCLMHPEYCQR
ncbi:MAG TPA: hypothetical protein VGU20_01265 [Stellaceae bacterium]|nr:hypothetical protein [Stellaceae bacterium]